MGSYYPLWVVLLAAYWQGFALAFYCMTAIFWGKPYFENHDKYGNKKTDDPAYERPFWERLVIAIAGFSGLFSAIATLAIFHTMQNTDIVPAPVHGVFLVGALSGLLAVLLVRKRLFMKK